MLSEAANRAGSEESSGLSPPPAVIKPPAIKSTSNGTGENKKRKRDAPSTSNDAVTGNSDPIDIKHVDLTTPEKPAARSKKATPKKQSKTATTTTTTTTIQDETIEETKTSAKSPKSARKRKAVEYTEGDVLEQEVVGKPKGRKKVKVEKDNSEEEVEKKPKGGRKAKVVEAGEDTQVDQDAKPVVEKKVQRKRKTKEEKEAEAMPLAPRTRGHKMFIGAHVSGSGGVHNSVLNSVHIGANAFALFLKSQRKWANPPLDPTVCSTFHDHCETHSYDQNKHVLPHGSYLVNLAHTDPARTKQAYDSFLDDLQRCERLGISLYNFHPGNVAGKPRPEAIAHLASNLNRAHKETDGVVTVLENMAAGGNVIGSTFEDLRDVIALVKDKTRVGVCIDTCHAFAAGYDLRNREALEGTLKHFDETVGMKYLRALHINDSKAPLNSRRDLHANIGTGFLGLRAFHAIMNESRFEGLPMVLETPIELRDENGDLIKDEKGKAQEDKQIWATEIKLLESLVGMDDECAEFVEMEARLQKKGAGERSRVNDQVERRNEKAKTKAAKGTKGSRKKGKADDDDGSSLSDMEEEE